MTLETALRALAAAETRLHDLEAERSCLTLRVKDLEQQLAARKSPRAPGAETPALSFFQDPHHPDSSDLPADGGASRPGPAAGRPRRREPSPRPRGRQPLDPALPREVIRLPDPPEAQRVDALTGAPLVLGFTETLEVLARRPAVYFVRRYERTVWVSPDKTAPLATPWPASALPRSRVDASIVAHIAAAHFSEHLPYYRLEQQLARTGVTLPRNTQVSLMAQLDARVAPVVEALKSHVLASGYIHLDATPIDVCDPARPGEARSATVWAYRARSPDPNEDGLVWFDYRATKSPVEPSAVLRAAQYRGVVQTDGAAGLDTLGPPEHITHLACWAHARRYVADALATDARATPYLAAVDRLFRIDARARAIRRALPADDPRLARLATWRTRFSIPITHALFTRAATEIVTLPPKTPLATALGYLLGQRTSLRRCVTTANSSLDNNPVENAIRPLKLGARNWLFIGHPDAGPRLANLFTLVENCRHAGIDAEAYLIDLVTALAAGASTIIADWLPRVWKRRRADGLTS
ncbi:MAG TPA: IS66 family transposase [Gemmatimonadaceae bacterium]|jgi:transposase